MANPIHASADVCVDKKGKARKGISIMLKYRCPSIEQTASGGMSFLLQDRFELIFIMISSCNLH